MTISESFILLRTVLFTGFVVFALCLAITMLLPKKLYDGDRFSIALLVSLAVGLMYASIYSELTA